LDEEVEDGAVGFVEGEERFTELPHEHETLINDLFHLFTIDGFVLKRYLLQIDGELSAGVEMK
jgi:hypothetical protein